MGIGHICLVNDISDRYLIFELSVELDQVRTGFSACGRDFRSGQDLTAVAEAGSTGDVAAFFSAARRENRFR